MKYRNDMHIYIDNYDNGTHQLSDIIDFVTQYRFQGGPEQPMRYLEMKVNKNDIDKANPHLIDTVVEGKTRLIIDAVGIGTFIITKIWLNNNAYELVATGIEITLNTATLSSTLCATIDATNKDPPTVVKTIFDDWESTLNLANGEEYKIYFSPSLDPTRTPSGKTISFKEDMPTLVAINMCALMDNAFVFFANKVWDVIEDGETVQKVYNTMYYVSYDDIVPLAYNPADDDVNGVVNVYPRMTSIHANYTKFDLMMFQKLRGTSSKNSEGAETIVNNQIVSVNGSKSEYASNDSIAMYGDYAGAQVVSDMIVTAYASTIAENIVRRYKDPTRSITILLSENVNDNTGSGWEEAIKPFSYAYKIVDNVNNITLTNTHLCDDTVDNFMLRLSTFIRQYPEMTTEYTFGVMKETTLSQELANKLTRQVTTEDIIDRIYPIGSIYLSMTNTNPATLFGVGTWTTASGTPPVTGCYMWQRTA